MLDMLAATILGLWIWLILQHTPWLGEKIAAVVAYVFIAAVVVAELIPMLWLMWLLGLLPHLPA